MLKIECFAAAAATVAEGIFIPVADLPGMTAAEFIGDTVKRDGQVTLAILNKLTERILAAPALGLSIVKGVPTGISPDVWNQAYTINATFMGNYANNSLAPIPIATLGANIDSGSFYISDAFPGAIKLAAATDTGGAGILIPSAELANYGAPNYANTVVAADGRGWIFALINYLVNAVEKRVGPEGRAAIISASKTASLIFAPPAIFTDSTNPTSGVLATELPLRTFLTTVYSLVIQFQANQNTQTFDVRVLDS